MDKCQNAGKYILLKKEDTGPCLMSGQTGECPDPGEEQEMR